MLFCVIPAGCCVKFGCHTYKEFRCNLVQILLIGSTHIPAGQLVTGVPGLCLGPGISPLPQGEPREYAVCLKASQVET